MAFDFKSREGFKVSRKSPTSKNTRKTFEESLNLCLTSQFDTQIENFQTKNLLDKNGKAKAGNWMMKDEKGIWFISYRIKGKPIYFTEEIGADKGWIKSDDVVSDLNEIRKDLENGLHMDLAREAFNRPSPKEKKASETQD
jgi:hypothetical protein